MRLAVDTGGTFTDLVIQDSGGALELLKAPTDVDDPAAGVMAVLGKWSDVRQTPLSELLGACDLFIHGTTRGLNAVVTGNAARTAFLTTEGHPDILLFREGGRLRPFDHRRAYPDPYVPRALTFEVRERIDAAGRVVTELDESQAISVIEGLREAEVEAVAVCLLWSVVNPEHENRLGELLDERLPGVPYTLSHRLNPTVREYRRASSTCLDASLKPLMSQYFRDLETRVRVAGFEGRLLVVTSGGGVLDAEDVAQQPIHSLGSGPAMAPVAGRHHAAADLGATNVIVADAGGTTYDVSVARNGAIAWTRETWLGEEYSGHLTGFPAVDVRSVGAGGGSIAWVDDGGMLHVGPQSAGSHPGPACYGRGGSLPTVTDACLVLGFLDPDYFLGGDMRLDREVAADVLTAHLSAPLGLDARACAAAVLEVVTEEMVRAIEDTTLVRGVDASTAVLVAGGGASGLNCVAIARRLGCGHILVPQVGPALSAAGALLSDLTADFLVTLPGSTDRFDRDAVNAALAELMVRCHGFFERAGADGAQTAIDLSVEARYPDQVWEIETPVRAARFDTAEDVERLRADFHATHEDLFGISDPTAPVELVTWRARGRCLLSNGPDVAAAPQRPAGEVARQRRDVSFGYEEPVAIDVHGFDALPEAAWLAGPFLVESPATTIVIPPGAAAQRTSSGGLLIDPRAGHHTQAGDPS